MRDDRPPGRSPGSSGLPGPACPLPIEDPQTIQLAHGGGGRMSRWLQEEVFLPAFANEALERRHDGAILPPAAGRLAFTTDSYVVKPLFFPGGDIGSLSVHGTVNDLAMCGARPLALSAGFILEEGLPLATLRAIVTSMARAAQGSRAPIVTGDTKVVDRGKGDGLYVNTSGIGIVPPGIDLDPRRARPGDVVLLSGEIALHGIAILSVREGLSFETTIESDSAALDSLVGDLLLRVGGSAHVLRDPTRGGVSSALSEIAEAAGVGIVLEEKAIPLREEVRGACEILGFDPLYVANEGKCLAIVARAAAEEALEALRAHPLGRQAAVVGEVTDSRRGVHLRSRIGGMRVVEMLSGEQLPRIC